MRPFSCMAARRFLLCCLLGLSFLLAVFQCLAGTYNDWAANYASGWFDSEAAAATADLGGKPYCGVASTQVVQTGNPTITRYFLNAYYGGACGAGTLNTGSYDISQYTCSTETWNPATSTCVATCPSGTTASGGFCLPPTCPSNGTIQSGTGSCTLGAGNFCSATGNSCEVNCVANEGGTAWEYTGNACVTGDNPQPGSSSSSSSSSGGSGSGSSSGVSGSSGGSGSSSSGGSSSGSGSSSGGSGSSSGSSSGCDDCSSSSSGGSSSGTSSSGSGSSSGCNPCSGSSSGSGSSSSGSSSGSSSSGASSGSSSGSSGGFCGGTGSSGATKEDCNVKIDETGTPGAGQVPANVDFTNPMYLPDTTDAQTSIENSVTQETGTLQTAIDDIVSTASSIFPEPQTCESITINYIPSVNGITLGQSFQFPGETACNGIEIIKSIVGWLLAITAILWAIKYAMENI